MEAGLGHNEAELLVLNERESSWSHQLREFSLYRDEPARALHWQMRTGKTKAMIDLACYLYDQGRIDGVLVLAPNNVHANWPRKQLGRHTWATVPYTAVTWDSQKANDVRYDMAFGEMLKSKGLAWFCVNVQALGLKRPKEYIRAFMKRRRFMLIVDETHDWRRPGSKRSQYTRRHVAPKAVVRRNLSGTMIDNSPFHAYSQYEILSKGALGFTDYKAFEQHFGLWEEETIYQGGRPRTIPKLKEYRNLEELRERMAAWTSYVYRDEVDDMPELVLAREEFGLTGQQKRVYNELARKGLVKLDTGEYLGEAEGGVLITRLQQVASGWVVDEDGEVHDLIPPEENPRLNRLVDEIVLADGKVIVFCRFREDIVRVLARLRAAGIKCVDYYGGTKRADRARNEDAFQNDPTVRVLVANASACGQGLDFSAGSYIVWYSHTHGDLIGRRQADERCTQVGGRKIGVVDLVAAGTVDEKILDDQDFKVETTDYLTGDGLRRYLELVK